MANEQTLPEGTPVKKSKVKKFVLLFSLVLLLGGIGGGAYWFLSNDPALLNSILGSDEEEEKPTEETAEATEETTEEEENTKNTKPTPTKLYSLIPLTINLSDTGASKYLKIGIDLELVSEQAVNDVKAQQAKIRDSIIILLSSKSYSNLASTEGKIVVKSEIASRINQVLGKPSVIQVYFTDFVIQ